VIYLGMKLTLIGNSKYRYEIVFFLNNRNCHHGGDKIKDVCECVVGLAP